MNRYFILTVFLTGSVLFANGPKYETAETKTIIESMIKSHGGYETWINASSTSFHTYFQINFGDGIWAPFREELVVHPKTRKVYGKLPNPDNTFGLLAFDGEKAWLAGNPQGLGKFAPARFTAWRDFYLFNIVWLTQDGGVKLSAPQKGKLEVINDPKEYIIITMTFDDNTGDTPKDYYKLYIDPKTFKLKASEYVMTYASMMQEGNASSPPSVFIWEETAEIKGLVFPVKYTVYWKDRTIAVKDGAVTNWSLEKKFDETQVSIPKDGVVDQSKPR